MKNAPKREIIILFLALMKFFGSKKLFNNYLSSTRIANFYFSSEWFDNIYFLSVFENIYFSTQKY